MPLKSKRELVMVVFGDSVSGGFGVAGIRESYGGILKLKISELFNCPVSFINSSREDESYMFSPRRLQADILSFRPDITFVMLGLVDAFVPGMLPSNHEKNIQEFYSVLKKSNTFLIVLTTTGLRDIKDSEDSRLITLNDFNQIIRDTAQYYHFPVIDVARHMENFRLANPTEYISLFNGPFLLNEKGNQFVADFIFQSIEKNFTEDIDSAG
ncbi:SGNH/GDSL hydrolase family protein [Candidatus Latescibacterota bacterium]